MADQNLQLDEEFERLRVAQQAETERARARLEHAMTEDDDRISRLAAVVTNLVVEVSTLSVALTGNSHPNEGFFYRLLMVERTTRELQDWLKQQQEGRKAFVEKWVYPLSVALTLALLGFIGYLALLHWPAP